MTHRPRAPRNFEAAGRIAALAALLLTATAACSDDGGDGDGPDPTPNATPDTTPEVTPDMTPPPTNPPEMGPAFRFGLRAAAERLSALPFPNDLHIAASGKITVGDLKNDPLISTLAKPADLDVLRGYMNEREGFGPGGAVFFFMRREPELASFEGRVRIITLSGPAARREITPQVTWSPEARALVVMPAWGDWMMADSRYAVIITRGVTEADGTEILPTPEFAQLVAPQPRPMPPVSDDARETYRELRGWMAEKNLAPMEAVIGTVFRTEPVVEYGQRLFASVDAFALEPVTRRVRWDKDAGAYVEGSVIDGADLDAYFGVPEAPFEHNPGRWTGFERANAATIAGDGPYTGGTGHFRVGRVINGSFVVPAFNVRKDGEGWRPARLEQEGEIFSHELKAMVPFTLFLCESHLADPSNIPVALINHGGTGIRADVTSFVNTNCESGVASIAHDMLSHAGRLRPERHATEDLLLAVRPDEHNEYTQLSAGDAGFVPDEIGDFDNGVAHVAPMFALAENLDPMIMEANLLTVAADGYAILRYVKEGDWSGVQDGLSFDTEHIFHQSLSFGSGYTTALAALSDDFKGVVTSVPTANMVSQNLPLAPSNATEASAVIFAALGLKTNPVALRTEPWRDFILNQVQWLHGRGDAYVWAPYVMRFRPSGKSMSVLSSGNSFDGTLFNGGQTTMAKAYGIPVFTDGEDWTMRADAQGADMLEATPFEGETVSANVDYGGVAHSSGMFMWNRSCHTLSIIAYCSRSFELPYPPTTTLEEREIFPSPVCELQGQVKVFLDSLLADGATHADISRPTMDCATLYGGGNGD